MDFPWCSNADIDWYMRTPADPPLVDSRDEMLLGQCKEENETLEVPVPMTDDWLHIEKGWNICWNKNKTVPVGWIQYLAGHSGQIGRSCTTSIT